MMKPRVACQCWLLPALATLLALATVDALGQGTTVYGHFPTTEPVVFPYDAEGTRLWAEPGMPPQTYDLKINGQTAFTFYSGTDFSIIPSSLNAVIGVQPGLPDDQSPFAIALAAGQPIGPEAAGYDWLPNIPGIGGPTLVASRDIGSIGYFAGIESAYLGLQFQLAGQTYYGWARAGAPVGGINGGWIYDYAYQTMPNTPILAGQVPEPSTFALLLVSGAAFWLVRKRW
jgi:hypothetical protein